MSDEFNSGPVPGDTEQEQQVAQPAEDAEEVAAQTVPVPEGGDQPAEPDLAERLREAEILVAELSVQSTDVTGFSYVAEPLQIALLEEIAEEQQAAQDQAAGAVNLSAPVPGTVPSGEEGQEAVAEQVAAAEADAEVVVEPAVVPEPMAAPEPEPTPGPESEPEVEPPPPSAKSRRGRRKRKEREPEPPSDGRSVIDAVADLMQFIVDWLRQEAEAIMREKIVLPLQKLGLTLASGCAAAMLAMLGIAFIAVGIFMLLGNWIGYPAALLLIGGLLVLGAIGFTVVKMRSMQK
jgi:hypothetical protein